MLTELQEAFCQAYTGVCQGNATVAYKMAGYTAKNQAVAQANGPTLLKKKEVQARIKELREKQKDDPNILTPKQMQQFLTYVVRLVMEAHPAADDSGGNEVNGDVGTHAGAVPAEAAGEFHECAAGRHPR